MGILRDAIGTSVMGPAWAAMDTKQTPHGSMYTQAPPLNVKDYGTQGFRQQPRGQVGIPQAGNFAPPGGMGGGGAGNPTALDMPSLQQPNAQRVQMPQQRMMPLQMQQRFMQMPKAQDIARFGFAKQQPRPRTKVGIHDSIKGLFAGVL